MEAVVAASGGIMPLEHKWGDPPSPRADNPQIKRHFMYTHMPCVTHMLRGVIAKRASEEEEEVGQ